MPHNVLTISQLSICLLHPDCRHIIYPPVYQGYTDCHRESRHMNIYSPILNIISIKVAVPFRMKKNESQYLKRAFGTHHRRPKAGPATQSLQRERNPKGSRRRLCALAGRGPPTEMQGKCRRCREKEKDLRQKCGKSVGGPGLSRGTSDGNTGKVSEVQSRECSPGQPATWNPKP